MFNPQTTTHSDPCVNVTDFFALWISNFMNKQGEGTGDVSISDPSNLHISSNDHSSTPGPEWCLVAVFFSSMLLACWCLSASLWWAAPGCILGPKKFNQHVAYMYGRYYGSMLIKVIVEQTLDTLRTASVDSSLSHRPILDGKQVQSQILPAHKWQNEDYAKILRGVSRCIYKLIGTQLW